MRIGQPHAYRDIEITPGNVYMFGKDLTAPTPFPTFPKPKHELYKVPQQAQYKERRRYNQQADKSTSISTSPDEYTSRRVPEPSLTLPEPKPSQNELKESTSIPTIEEPLTRPSSPTEELLPMIMDKQEPVVYPPGMLIDQPPSLPPNQRSDRNRITAPDEGASFYDMIRPLVSEVGEIVQNYYSNPDVVYPSGVGVQYPPRSSYARTDRQRINIEPPLLIANETPRLIANEPYTTPEVEMIALPVSNEPEVALPVVPEKRKFSRKLPQERKKLRISEGEDVEEGSLALIPSSSRDTQPGKAAKKLRKRSSADREIARQEVLPTRTRSSISTQVLPPTPRAQRSSADREIAQQEVLPTRTRSSSESEIQALTGRITRSKSKKK